MNYSNTCCNLFQQVCVETLNTPKNTVHNRGFTMFKSALTGTTIFLALVTHGFAQEKTTTDTDYEKPVVQTTQVSPQRPFPVIIQNEVISAGLCRLHMDDGTVLEVSCTHTKEEIS
jgi:hypothetical protein